MRDSDRVLLKQVPNHGGYYRVQLWKDGARHWRRVHVLVLEAFTGSRPSPRHHAAHGPDRQRTNNSLDNLRWATPEENEADKLTHGTGPKGGRVNELSEATIAAIREAIVIRGLSNTEVARTCNVHRKTAARERARLSVRDA